MDTTPFDAPLPIDQRRPRRRNRLRLVLLVIALLLIAGVGWRIYSIMHGAPAPAAGGQRGAGRRGGPPGGEPGADVPQAVGVAPVATGDIPIVLTELGTVTPLATVTVRSQISGYLTQIAFTEGQMVKKGDFLAQIDPRPYQVSLAQFQGQLLRDQALLKNAQLDLVRYQRLNAEDSISRQNVDTQASLVGQYEGTAKADQAQIDAQKLNLAYCHIVAPVDGRVGLRQVDQGNYVASADTNGIVVVTQLHPISVVFTLPEDALPQVAKRLRTGQMLQVAAFDRSNTTQLADGTVDTVDNVIDTTTGTIKVRASFDNGDGQLFPNQFVNARLLVDTVRGAVVVPTAAIQRGVDGTFVYAVKDDSTVSVRPVKTGLASGDRTSIVSGLRVGERVVTDGADRLRDGQKVLIPPPPPAPGAPAADAGPNGARNDGGRRRQSPGAATVAAPPPADQTAGSGPAGSTPAADTAGAGVNTAPATGAPSPVAPPASYSDSAVAEGYRPAAATADDARTAPTQRGAPGTRAHRQRLDAGQSARPAAPSP